MKTICCFGHRNVFKCIENAEELINLKKELYLVIEQQIKLKDANVFMTGRRGEFDNIFAFVIRQLKEKYPNIKLVLVEPYFSNSLNKYKDYFESMFDSIIIPDELAGVHPKKAIKLRNRWMVEKSYMIISCVNYRSGGAYEAIKYADELGKLVYNVGKISFKI